jgi:acetyl esterase/lipase
MHGTLDVTVPWYESVDMARALRDAGARVRLLLYDWVPHIAFATAWTAGDLAQTRSFQRDVLRLLLDEVGVQSETLTAE